MTTAAKNMWIVIALLVGVSIFAGVKLATEPFGGRAEQP